MRAIKAFKITYVCAFWHANAHTFFSIHAVYSRVYRTYTSMYKLEVTIARKVLPHPQGMAPVKFAE